MVVPHPPRRQVRLRMRGLRETVDGEGLVRNVTDKENAAPPRHKRPKRCDYICLLPADHDGTHFEGYEVPSPRRYDQMREWKIGRLHILWSSA